MGGGGTYYDRDTTDGYTKTSRGFSTAAEELMSQNKADPSMLPKGRTITSKAKSPVVYAFDVTGSVDNLPMIITDKMPLIAGQIVELSYLDDPEFCLGAIGDPECDSAPIQIGDFSKIKNLDDWLKRIWRENGGGGNNVEGYEFMAYFLANNCKMPNAITPICLFTGDEGIRDTLYKADLERQFGGTHESITSVEVFKQIDTVFKGNVFLIHRKYRGGDEEALRGWRQVMPDDRIIRLGSDLSIGDLTLGLLALVGGARTLDEYLKDMKTTRDKAQSDERVAEIRKSLEPVAKMLSARPKTSGKKTSGAKPGRSKDKDKPVDPKKPAKGKKPWQI